MDLHLDLSAVPGRSLRARLELALREAIRGGRLAGDERLPSTRELAIELGVSRGVVVDAYAQLAAEGYLNTRRGGGTRVARMVARGRPDEPAPARPERIRYDLSPFRPALGAVPRRALSAALARVLRETPDERLGLPDPAETFELRVALASYLGRVRGVQTSAEQLVITSGTRHGLSLVWRALATAGVRRVAIEDPGWSGIGETAVAAGLQPVPVPVDDDGLLVDALSAAPVDAVAVAPAHQYPTGAVLSAERRGALLQWARTGTRLVIEDDYDAEYRYDHQPIGSLQGLAPEHVIYAGSSSKTVAPSLRVGWLVVPARVRDAILDFQLTAGTIPGPIVQLAVADLIERGELDRHLRRQRRHYREQRAVLLDALARELPELTVRGAAAGLYAVVSLPAELDESAVVKAARARGLAIEGRGTAAPGLVLGYADVDAAAIAPAVSALAASIDDVRGRDDVVLIGGPEKRQIVIVEYDPGWPARFEQERTRAQRALGPAALSIEHIGSTAVPGLAAKPIIDLLVTVQDPDDDSELIAALESVGYELRVREPGHRMFRTPQRDVHVHVWAHSDPEVARYLRFRNRLRASPEDRHRYEQRKRELATRDWPDMNDYADAKGPLVEDIITRAAR